MSDNEAHTYNDELSLDEATTFAKKMLKIPDIIDSIAKQPLDTLNDIAKKYQLSVPFQNILLLSQHPGSTGIPDFAAIKSRILSGCGGMCYDNNVFLCRLLQTLGYKAGLAPGAVTNADDHAVTLVTLQSVVYLLDAGLRTPLFQAIPLDFEAESPTYDLGFLVHKFVRDGDQIRRLGVKRGRIYISSSEFNPGDETIEWRSIFTFRQTTVDVEYFRDSMSKVYTKYFLSNLLITRFENKAAFVIEDFDKTTTALSVKSHQMTLAGTRTDKLETLDDVCECIHNTLPSISLGTVQLAMKQFLYYKEKHAGTTK